MLVPRGNDLSHQRTLGPATVSYLQCLAWQYIVGAETAQGFDLGKYIAGALATGDKAIAFDPIEPLYRGINEIAFGFNRGRLGLADRPDRFWHWCYRAAIVHGNYTGPLLAPLPLHHLANHCGAFIDDLYASVVQDLFVD